MPVADPDDLADPRLFINRELSLLEFNRRVLEQAKDETVPLLERLRFLSISSTNLDEFFEIRVASHKERASYATGRVSLDGRTSQQTLQEIKRSASDLVAEQYRVLNDLLLPALEGEGIRLLRREEWDGEQRRWLARYFRRQVLPVLAPVGLDPAHPFPRILNKSLNFVVPLEGDDAYGRDTDLAVVQVPRSLPRILQMPSEVGGGPHAYVMLSSVIHAHIDELFPGVATAGCHQFRVTRNGDLWVDEEEVEDILQALRGELPERRYSEAVRLEVAEDCPDTVARFLLGKFELSADDLYQVDGPVNLHRLVALHELVDRPDLKYEPFVPRIPRRILRGESIFDAIRAVDVLLHHPYESFQPVLELLRQAAADPDVLAIQQTLYRTGGQALVAEPLIEAARAGKQVTVVVELRARFDEAENIDLATRLQDVGANVVYGVVGYKTHAKMLLVVRREAGELRRYVHLGTGNYHPGTARAYTDIGFLTADPVIAEDVQRVFAQLTGVGRVRELERLLQSPFTMHERLVALIDAESERARAGEPARIVAKMNALTERATIQALYRASQAGVRVELIIRGPCCLRPGIPGISENVTVRSIIGQFLEHSRLWWFQAGGEGRLYASSADWMSRNLLRRVEVAFPIEDPAIRNRLLREDLEVYLENDVAAWVLRSTGTYERVPHPDAAESPRDAQATLLETICAPDERGDGDRLHPRRSPIQGLLSDEAYGNDDLAAKKKKKKKDKEKKRRA